MSNDFGGNERNSSPKCFSIGIDLDEIEKLLPGVKETLEKAQKASRESHANRTIMTTPSTRDQVLDMDRRWREIAQLVDNVERLRDKYVNGV